MPESGRVQSPCISVCALDDKDICIGCHRSAQEIGAWINLDDEARRVVLANAERRYREEWGLPQR